MKRIILFIVFAIYTNVSYGLNPSDITFSNIPESQGYIYSITEDNEGYMWFATEEGLFRYDGFDFKSYNFLFDKFGHDILFNALICNNKDTLYIGTSSGMFAISGKNNLYKIDKLNIPEIKKVRTLATDNYGTIWIGCPGKVVKFISTDEYHIIKHEDFKEIRTILPDSENNIWIGGNNGLFLYDSNTGAITNVGINHRQYSYDPERLFILSIHESGKYIWIGSTSGLIKMNKTNLSYRIFRTENTEGTLSNNAVKCILPETHGNLLLGTSIGIDIFDPETCKSIFIRREPGKPNSLCTDIVETMYLNKNGILWVGTSNGVSQQNMAYPGIEYHHISYNDHGNDVELLVNDIKTDREGNIWLASNNGLMKVSPHGRKQIISNEPSQRLIVNDSSQSIIIETYSGLRYIDNRPSSKKEISIREIPKPVKTDHLNHFESLPNETFVISGNQSIYYFNIQNRTDSINVEKKSVTKIYGYISDLITDKSGNVYIGLGNGDVIKTAIGQSPEVITNITKTGHRNIRSMCLNKYGLWVATETGILRIDLPSGKISDSEKLYLLGNNIMAITSDKHDRIWYSQKSEITCFDPSSEQNYRMPVNDIRFNGFKKDCAFYDERSNTILFGTYNGYVSAVANINPTNISPKRGIIVTSISNFGKEIPINDTIRLNGKNNNIILSFASLDFNTCGTPQFFYKIHETSGNWQHIPYGQNSLVLNNLAYGKYHINIMSSSDISCKPKSILIEIPRPVWIKWWAFVLYSAIFMLITFLVGINYIRTSKMKDQIKLQEALHNKDEELLRIKTNFFTNISHEIRTPLTLILAPIKKLKEKITDPDISKEIEIMDANADRLLRLINSILDIRKLDQGKMKLNPSVGDIIYFLRDIFNCFIGIANEKKIEYVFSSGYESLLMEFDRKKIETILYNILSNAFKYTDNGGKITLTITCSDDNKFIMKVSDNGQGIPEDKQKIIFERFVQADYSPYHTGSGIGLALVKEYVEMMSGEVVLESKPNEGTSFTISLPLKTAEVEDGLWNGIKIDENRHKLLIVEDDYQMREYLSRLFCDYFNVFSVSDGEKALEMAQKADIEIIISDYMMPHMDGITLCRKIKEKTLTSHIYFMLLTAKEDHEIINVALESGVDDYVTKPFDPSFIHTKIDNYIESLNSIHSYYKQRMLTEPKETLIESDEDKLLKRIMDVIEQNIQDPDISLSGICSQMNMPQYQVYRKIKAITGYSLNEFVRNIRLKKAKQLLESSDKNITEVMYMVGFNHRSYFSKAFSALFGLSPKEYRNSVTKSIMTEDEATPMP